jgi:hypothetical protein
MPRSTPSPPVERGVLSERRLSARAKPRRRATSHAPADGAQEHVANVCGRRPREATRIQTLGGALQC